MVALETNQFGVVGECITELSLEFGERRVAIDLGFAFTEAVEIGAVEDGDAFHG